jgi:hypothetical protein
MGIATPISGGRRLFDLLLSRRSPPRPAGSPERPELVTAKPPGAGRRNRRAAAQCPGAELQLFISARTVGSHLDRIRDKTGCRRRADLARLALQAGLV